jgi:hypothetical protein
MVHYLDKAVVKLELLAAPRTGQDPSFLSPSSRIAPMFLDLHETSGCSSSVTWRHGPGPLM